MTNTQQTDMEIFLKNWKKNWAGGWSILSCAYLGEHYTKLLKEGLGIGLEEALFVSHNGISSCYFIDVHKNDFGQHFAAKAKENPELISTWAQGLISAADAVLALKEKLVELPATKENFDLFFEGMNQYGIYHRYVKMVVDFLPKETLDKYLAELSEARVHAEPVYEEMEKYMQYFAAKVANGTIAPELVLAMTRSQFEGYLEDGTCPSVETLKEQREDSALYLSTENERYFVGHEAVLTVEQALLKAGEGNEIRGQTAYAGKVQGHVRVILDVSKPVEFIEGEILVTGMTRPDYLPYVKKCAGFVTDAGGILSHAAITARELKKPCVIGTEVATKVLKDGDIVEIDADHGVVRKIV